MKLTVQKRTTTGKELRKLRKQDIMPGIVYAKHIDEPIKIQCRRQDFVKIYKEGGRSTVIDLSGDDIEESVLIHEIQIDPVTHKAVHADFVGILAGQEIQTEVSLVMIGKAPVVTSSEIKIQQVKDTLEIKAKPKDLPHDIKIDISGMENEDDVIYVRDLPIPSGVTIVDEEDVAVARVLVAQEEVMEELETLNIDEEGTDVSAQTTNEGSDGENTSD